MAGRSTLSDGGKARLREFALQEREERPFWPRTSEIVAFAAKELDATFTLQGISLVLRSTGLVWQNEHWVDPEAERTPEPWEDASLPLFDRMVMFIEGLPVTKGLLRGRNVTLLPSQKEFLWEIYGGHRKVRIAVKSEPRGNGKTGLLAPMTLGHLAGPASIPRGETYSAAIDRNQAAILFNEMAAIVAAKRSLAARVAIHKHLKQLEVVLDGGPGEGSTYEAMSGDARSGHGLAPSFWSYDELARVKDRELLDALVTGMGKQPNALGVVISTQAPDDEHPLSELIDDGLEGHDPSIVVQLHAAPEEADPYDPEVWKACNPALGVFLDYEEFEKQANAARRLPSFMSNFRNLRLNQRVAADERLIGKDDWLACKGELDVAKLRGRKCWGGLDLSSTTDLTAFVLVFEADELGGPCPVVPWFWMPRGKIEEMQITDGKNYRAWIETGLIEATSGRAIDKMAIALRLAEINAIYDLQVIGFDDWRFADLQKLLDDEGIRLPLRPMRQGYKTMAPCVDALEGGVINREIVHDGNAVLTYCIANAVVDRDPSGNRKLDKKRSRSRIDGAVCLAVALGLRAIMLASPEDRAFRGDDVDAVFADAVVAAATALDRLIAHA